MAKDIYAHGGNDGVWGFGDNSWNQLGSGTGRVDTPRFYPFKMFENQEIRQIACGAEFTIFLTSNGQLWGLGYPQYGQLGEQDTTQGYLKTVKHLTSFDVCGKLKQIAAGAEHTMVLSEDHQWLSGYNSNKELGNGTTTNSFIPQNRTYEQLCEQSDPWLLDNDYIVEVKCGSWHSLARSNNGHVFWWGLSRESKPKLLNRAFVEVVAMEGGDGFSIMLDSYHRAWMHRAEELTQIDSSLPIRKISAKHDTYALLFADSTFSVHSQRTSAKRPLNSYDAVSPLAQDLKHVSDISVNYQITVICDDGFKSSVHLYSTDVTTVSTPFSLVALNNTVSHRPRSDVQLTSAAGYNHVFVFWRSTAMSKGLRYTFEVLKRQAQWTKGDTSVVEADVDIHCGH